MLQEIAISEGQYQANGGIIRQDPCDVVDSPGPRLRVPPGWLDWSKPYEPVAIVGGMVRLYHIPDPDAARDTAR